MSTTNTLETPTTSIPNTATVRTAFAVPAPHPVTYTPVQTTTTITEIATNSGLVIERGHQLSNKRPRRNLKDFFANFQVGDKVNSTTLRETVSLYNSMRYRGWTSTYKKQGNGSYDLQRLS